MFYVYFNHFNNALIEREFHNNLKAFVTWFLFNQTNWEEARR